MTLIHIHQIKSQFLSALKSNFKQLCIKQGLARTHNSTFAIGGVSCSAESLVVAESFVLRISISGKNPAHRQSVERLRQWYQTRNEPTTWTK